MRILHMTAVAAVWAAGVVAEEHTLELNNIYPQTEETIYLSEGAFFVQDNIGGFETVQGPFEDGPTRCVGSGLFFGDGRNTVQGICIFGEGADTFTMTWKAGEKGKANDWEIIDGTGRYAGMSGAGIATTDIVSMYKALPLRKTHLIGKVTLP